MQEGGRSVGFYVGAASPLLGEGHRSASGLWKGKRVSDEGWR